MDKITSYNLPTVTVIIPMRNEEKHIARCLQSVISQDYPSELIEVIVVDGGSTDRSLEIVGKLSGEHRNIKLLGGPGVNCPAAMNEGIRNAKGELISKIDAHGYMASDFLRVSAKYVSEEKSIKCVGGPIRPVTQNSVAEANALARSSIFGVGRGVYSTGEKAQFMDTVQCGTYEKGIFEEVGLFDESLQFGEDEEINWRIRKKGYKILFTPEIKFFYFPRNSFRQLFRQYYNYGMARMKVIQKHPDFINIKHVTPTAFVLALCTTGMFAIFSNLFLRLFLVIAGLYLIISLAFSALISVKEGCKYFGLMPISFAALHFGYGIGFLNGILRFCLRPHRKDAEDAKGR